MVKIILIFIYFIFINFSSFAQKQCDSILIDKSSKDKQYIFHDNVVSDDSVTSILQQHIKCANILSNSNIKKYFGYGLLIPAIVLTACTISVVKSDIQFEEKFPISDYNLIGAALGIDIACWFLISSASNDFNKAVNVYNSYQSHIYKVGNTYLLAALLIQYIILGSCRLRTL